MPADLKPVKIPAKRRGLLRRIVQWTLLVLLVLVVFHRPIVHFAARRVAIWFAAEEHMVLDFRLSGNLWSTLEARDVTIRADGKGPALIERLKLDRLAVEFDVRKVFRKDWRRVFRLVEIGTLDALVALQRPDVKKPIATILDKILSKSLSPVERLSAKSVTLEIKHVASIHGLEAEVRRDVTGHIAWQKIHVRGLPVLGATRAELITNESTFAVSKLTLLPDVVVRRLSLNRVTPTLPRGGLEVLLDAGGGMASLRIEPSLRPGALDLSLDVEAVQLNTLAQPFGVDLPAPSAIESFHAKVTGTPEDIDSATADAAFVVRMEEKAMFPAALVRGSAKWGRGVFRITELSASSSGIELRIGGELNVPLKNFAVSKLSGEITWDLSSADLTTLPFRDVPKIRGSLTGAGKLRLEGGVAHTTGDIQTVDLAMEDVAVEAGAFHVDARRKIESLSDILATLSANLSFDVKGVTAKGVRIDAMSATGKLDDQRGVSADFTVASGENRFNGSVRATLKPGAAGLAGLPELDVVIAAPRLEQFGLAVNGAALSGTVTAEGKVRLDGKRLTGALQANGTDLFLGKTPAGGFRAQVKFEEGAAILESLAVLIPGAGGISATGRASLEAPFAYSGEVSVNLTSLGKLDALLETAGHPAKLGGALVIDWSGSGKIADKAHSGKVKLSGKDVRRDTLGVSVIRVGGTYSPDHAETDELFVAMDKAQGSGRLRWSANRLNLADFLVVIAGQEAVKGEASIPFAPANKDAMLPPDQPVNLRLTGKNVDIAKLLTGAGLQAPVSGNVSSDLAVSGTIAKPEVKFSAVARSLQSPKLAAVAPGDVDLALAVTGSRLTLDAIVKQRDIQPLTMTASVPFDVEKLRANPALLRESPLSIVVKLPPSSLAGLPRFVPDIARADGTLAANVAVSGTVNRPVLSGEAFIVLRSVRFTAVKVPPVSNFKSHLVFRDRTVTLNDTRGEVGGGTFNVEGNVNVAQLDKPELDLRVRSNKVLLMRDESITVRADTDLTVKGPFNTTAVAGTAFVTQSRFLKDVDILPLTLPGKAKPQVRKASRVTRVSFPNPPLREMKFDVAIKTRENDSFLVRGNLAKGAGAIDVRLGGTGLNPFLTGTVQIENFTALLPVSKMEVQRGYAIFSEEYPFEPHLEIEAESRVGKNVVTMHITGLSSAPRLELESEPPLPQKDILSLLATGTTSGEIGSNASALATRALALQVKQWYRKAFRKGVKEKPVDDPESLRDRFEVDIGTVNPRTGRPDLTASVKITDKVFFLGEIDVDGDFSGKVKYLLRFR